MEKKTGELEELSFDQFFMVSAPRKIMIRSVDDIYIEDANRQTIDVVESIENKTGLSRVNAIIEDESIFVHSIDIY